MKKIILFLIAFIALPLLVGCASTPGEPKLGMDMKIFEKLYPGLIPENADLNGQWSREESIEGLEGKWNYDFKDGKLDWFLYSSYEDDITEENFKKYKEATQKIVAEYSQKWGPAAESVDQGTAYKDPYKEWHWGYEVIKAVWVKDNTRIKVEFVFFGGKGEFNYITNIWFQSPEAL